MNKIIYLLFFCATSLLTAQSKFDKGMEKAFLLWRSGNTDEASNLFERIAAAEKENWLPDYYVGQLQILHCWANFEKRDEAMLKSRLDKAQEYINTMLTKDHDTPYAKQLQAQLYTVWVAYDGMKYGMQYAGKVSELYAKALTQEPENPIFIFNKAEWDMGSAKFMGQDPTPYCKEVEKAIALFKDFKPKTAFHPTYGLERAEQVYKECSK